MRRHNAELERFRATHPTLGRGAGMFGFFLIGTPRGTLLRVISSGGATSSDVRDPQAWEHVSLSLADRTPSWEDMARVKDLFWRPDETVLQYHPKRAAYVNAMEFCLHLWKPPFEVALPPHESI